jgi:hypothetical protein
LKKTSYLAIRNLPDREKFSFAKNEDSLEILLDLINCDQATSANSDRVVPSQGTLKAKGLSNFNRGGDVRGPVGGDMANTIESGNGALMNMAAVKSDLSRVWLREESLISHCALN